MILRKPYAFLIKNFKKINILLLALTIFIYTKTIDIIGFAGEYSKTGVYNELNLISNYINPLFIISILVTIILSIILIYLLKHKEKPIKGYLLISIEYIILLFILIYTNSFYNDIDINGFNRQLALLIKDLLTIISIPQYLIMILLFIRSIGLDLKSFGFSEDKYLLANEEDREEVEVDTTFDKDKYKRKLKKGIRETKYFILENKVVLSIILTIVLLFTGVYGYKNIYLKNKIYGQNINIDSNYYTFNIKDSYYTNRDYKGDVIDKDSYFIILNLNVKNNLSYIRNIALNKFMLYVGNKYYVPDTSYNRYFKDMGEIYHNQNLMPNKNNNYFIVFRIEKPNKDDNFLLRYQDVKDKGNLIRIKLNIKDISPFIEKDKKNILEELKVPINLNKFTTIKINKFEVKDKINYNIVKCDKFNNCPVYQNILNSKENKQILVLKYLPIDKTREEIKSFVNTYGKIKYKVGNEIFVEKLDEAVKTDYYGNYLYYNVSDKIKNANNIELVFTVRSYQYIYKLS